MCNDNIIVLVHQYGTVCKWLHVCPHGNQVLLAGSMGCFSETSVSAEYDSFPLIRKPRRRLYGLSRL